MSPLDSEESLEIARKLFEEAVANGGFTCLACGQQRDVMQMTVALYRPFDRAQPGVFFLVCAACKEPTDEQMLAIEMKILGNPVCLECALPEGSTQ